jgi:hypothetical protein
MASRTRSPLDHHESPGLAAARRLVRADKGPPPEGYWPPAQVLRGRRVKVIPGQLDLDGNEHGHQ